MRFILFLFGIISINLTAQPPIYTITNTQIPTADNFGTSVAVAEEYIVVGCIGTNNSTGSIAIYKGAGPTWNLINTLSHSEGNEGDFMGMDVSMTEKHIIVGAPTDHWVDDQTGRAFIYGLENNEWTEQAILQPSSDFNQSAFGFIVNIHEDYAIVGAPDYGNVGGAAVLYLRIGNEWIEKQTFFTPSDEVSSFGGSVDVNDDWIAIGGYEQSFTNIEEGAKLVVYLYKRNGDQWNEAQKIEFTNQALSYQIPWYGVEFGDDQLVITNHRANALENIDGEIKVFQLEGETWIENQSIHPDGFALNEIGRHAAHSEKFAIIGASYPSANSTQPHHLLVYNKAISDNWDLIGDYAFEGSSSTNWQGFNLDINNNYAVASSHHHANEHGEVHVIDLRRFLYNEELLSDEEINIYPIPAYDNISLDSQNSPITGYMMVNQMGQIVKYESEILDYQIEVDIKDFPSGMYWIKVETTEGFLFRQFSKLN